jgi:hypothetical protein
LATTFAQNVTPTGEQEKNNALVGEELGKWIRTPGRPRAAAIEELGVNLLVR